MLTRRQKTKAYKSRRLVGHAVRGNNRPHIRLHLPAADTATVTVASVLLMIVLMLSEIRLFLSTEYQHFLMVDKTRSEALHIDVDVVFFAMRCQGWWCARSECISSASPVVSVL